MSSLNKQEILILVMGMTGAGKTTFINKASGSNLTIGEGLESCTSEVQAAAPFRLDGHVITLIDSPGFDDTNRSEAEILREVTSFLAELYEAGRLLAGIIYLHRISDMRVGGVAKRNLSVFRKLCGESTLKNAIVVTNMWTPNASDKIRAEEEGHETELAKKPAFFKQALDSGAHMARHHNTTESAHAIIRNFFAHKPQTLLVQEEIVDQKESWETTNAGSHLRDELMAMSKRHQREIEEMKRQQRELEEKLASASLKFQQNAALSEDLRKLRNELKKTSEALEGEQRKMAHVLQQVRVLKEKEATREQPGDTKNKREDARRGKGQQRTPPTDYARAHRKAPEESTRPRPTFTTTTPTATATDNTEKGIFYTVLLATVTAVAFVLIRSFMPDSRRRSV